MKCLIVVSLLFLSLACWSEEPSSDYSLEEMAEQAGTLTLLLKNIDEANSEQIKRLRDLESKLSYSETDVKALKDISLTQGEYVNRLLKEAELQGRIYNRQLEYQADLKRDLNLYKWLFRIGLPLAAAGAGYLGYRMAR